MLKIILATFKIQLVNGGIFRQKPSSRSDYTEVNTRLKAPCWLDKGITVCNSKCSS